MSKPRSSESRDKKRSAIRGKKIVLIGGSGFLGRHLNRELSTSPQFQVSVFTRSKGFNVLDSVQVTRELRTFDIIINLTGQVSASLPDCKALNTIGISNLLEVCKETGATFMQISSALVYGTAQTVNENSPLKPQSPYASYKAKAERLIEQSLLEDQYLILRLTNLYGPNQSKGLFWYLLSHIKAKSPIVIPDNDGSLKRNFLHVEDAARLISQLIQTNARGVWNIASPDTYTVRQIVEQCEELLKKKLDIVYAGGSAHSNVDQIRTDKLSKQITIQFKHSVKTFLQTELSPL